MADRAHDFHPTTSNVPEEAEKVETNNEKDLDHDLDSKAEIDGSNGVGEKLGGAPSDEKYEITEDDCYDELGYSFPAWKKWYILTVIFWVQVSMNFNTSLYSNAIDGITKQFHVSKQGARCGAMIFLVTYAFGCELWAPW